MPGAPAVPGQASASDAEARLSLDAVQQVDVAPVMMSSPHCGPAGSSSGENGAVLSLRLGRRAGPRSSANAPNRPIADDVARRGRCTSCRCSSGSSGRSSRPSRRAAPGMRAPTAPSRTSAHPLRRNRPRLRPHPYLSSSRPPRSEPRPRPGRSCCARSGFASRTRSSRLRLAVRRRRGDDSTARSRRSSTGSSACTGSP